MVGAILILISFPVAVAGGIMVRREEAKRWHMWMYMVSAGLLAVGCAWVSGFGLVGFVFFPVGVLLAWADSYLKIFNWFHG